MQDYPFIAICTLLFACPFVPAVLFACRKSAERRLARFALAEAITCTIVFLICLYMAELAPHQGVIQSKVFSGLYPQVELVWSAILWLFPVLGVGLCAYFARECLRNEGSSKYLPCAPVAAFSLVLGIATPYMMSQLVAAIRDAFLL